MKFWQKFEKNKLNLSTKFRGNKWRDFDFRTRKPHRRFDLNSGLIQKQLKYGKNISYGYIS